MNQIAQNTSSPERGDQLLWSFEIVRFPEYQQGRPYQQTRLMAFEGPPPATRFGTKLKDCRNWKGHSYAESHIEEWLSRSPTVLFPGRAVHVLASQNYAHLEEKIDLLFLDDRHQFHVFELKTERVASNRGVTPDQIWGQMNRYVDFLRRELLPFPASFRDYYAQFSKQFLGAPHDLTIDLREIFGEAYFFVPNISPILCRTFLTEGYDDHAVDFFRDRQQQGDGPIRLMYYRFYLCTRTERHYIEFWEVPIDPRKRRRVDQHIPTPGSSPNRKPAPTRALAHPSPSHQRPVPF